MERTSRLPVENQTYRMVIKRLERVPASGEQNLPTLEHLGGRNN